MAAKILCWDNDYVRKTKQMHMMKQRNASIELKNGPNQYAMSKRSYKPINQEARNNVNIVNFTPQQQQQKTPDQ